MKPQESQEMYLEVIYKLEQKNGTVRSVDIANELSYSKPSVSRAIGVLKKSGYITHTHYGDVTLTDEGRKKAKRIYFAHKLLTAYLVKVLKVDPDIAEEDACKIEHVISDETLDAMEKMLSDQGNN